MRKTSKKQPGHAAETPAADLPADKSAQQKQAAAKKPSAAKRPAPSAKAAGAKKSAKTNPSRKPAGRKAVASAAAEPSDAEVQLRAYFLAEKRLRHGLAGDSAHDWLEAKRQLMEEAALPRQRE